jgi:4-carboxymuconolactone decarboxylase
MKKNSPEWYDKGIAKRRQVLGDEYVDRSLVQANEFSQDFQEWVTASAWGFVWGDETLDLKTRSLMNLTMIAGLNRMEEWELHFKGAITNGVTLPELKAAIHQISAYCGAPAGVECFRIANRVLKEQGLVG